MINFRNIICRHLHRDGHPGKGSIQIGTHPNAGVSFPLGIQSPCRMIGASKHLSKVFTVGSITILRFGDWILIGIIMEGQPGSLRMMNLQPWIWLDYLWIHPPMSGAAKPKNSPTGPRLLCRPNRCPKNSGVGVGVGESPWVLWNGGAEPSSQTAKGDLAMSLLPPRKFNKQRVSLPPENFSSSQNGKKVVFPAIIFFRSE